MFFEIELWHMTESLNACSYKISISYHVWLMIELLLFFRILYESFCLFISLFILSWFYWVLQKFVPQLKRAISNIFQGISFHVLYTCSWPSIPIPYKPYSDKCSLGKYLTISLFIQSCFENFHFSNLTFPKRTYQNILHYHIILQQFVFAQLSEKCHSPLEFPANHDWPTYVPTFCQYPTKENVQLWQNWPTC